MANKYSEAPEVAKIVEKIRLAWHTDLDGFRIDACFREGTISQKGQSKLAVARLIQGLPAHLAGETEPFFLVEVASDPWPALTDAQKAAVIDHELCHFQVDYDEEIGEPRLWILGHPIEEFPDIVRRHGLWHSGLEIFADAIQLHFPLDGRRPAKATKAEKVKAPRLTGLSPAPQA